MGLIICCSCGRQRNVKPIKKNKPLVCSNCGAGSPRIVHNVMTKMRMADTSDSDGIEKYAARYRTMAGLKWIAAQKNYNQWWPYMQFKKIFGRKPNGEMNVEMEAPESRLLDWVKRRNAEYKKEMKAKGIPFRPKREIAAAVDGIVTTERADCRKSTETTERSLMSDDDWGEDWR